MARRPWGSGSLYRRKSDGRWIGRVSDGQGGHRYVTGKSRDEVRSRLRDLSKSSHTVRNKERVGDVIQRWLDDANHLRGRTRLEYQRVLRLHVEPAIGDALLSELRPQDIQRMVARVLEHRSAQTAKHAHKLVRTALNQAVRTGLVDRNVAALVKSPTVTRKPIVALTAAETRRFLEATKGEPLWPLWALAASTGMRRAELLGLRWQDVIIAEQAHARDRDGAKVGRQGAIPSDVPAASSVTVNVTIRPLKGATDWAVEEPKTPKSRRTLPLSPIGVAALARQKEHATSALWVFARPDGRPLDGTQVSKLFVKALARHGLPVIRFHDLRHGAAHMLLDAMGGDIRAVSSYLGHSTIATTVDIYGGRADEARQRAAVAIGKALEGLG